VRRRTRQGQPIGPTERVDPLTALNLYLGEAAAPGGPPRRIEVGAAADLCLLASPLAEALAEPSAERVRATIIGGVLVFAAD
jgi:predicted amidohydrolase YtcJ